MLPYVSREQRWISEGFAQYYQNVLLARAGRYTQQYAWERIREGLERGRDSVPALSPNQAATGNEYNSRMKIYWSGAALALIADVELRRRSGGTESLDLVLDRLQDCCLPSRRTWTGRELFEKFDSLIGEPLFVDLYERFADSRGFPEFEAALDDPAFAEIRATITARRYTGEPSG
jgi:predicted metalloprotease with PDZ domain